MRIVEKAQLMSAPEIDRTLQRLAHEIVEKSGGTKHLALIGIRRRGVPLAQRIAQAMRGIDGVEVPVGTLDITLYRDDLSKVASHAVLQSSDIPFGVDDMSNTANDAYAAWPERLYIIDESARIAYRGGMGPFHYDPKEVRAWLAAREGRSERTGWIH